MFNKYVPGSGVGSNNISVRRAKLLKASANCNRFCNIIDSTIKTIDINSTPSIPTNITAVSVINTNIVIISWNSPLSDGGNPILNYQIVNNVDNIIYTVSSTTFSLTLSNISINTTYVFYISAININGNSGFGSSNTLIIYYSSGLIFNSYTTLGTSTFSYFNQSAIDIFQLSPDYFGITTTIYDNYSDFNIPDGQSYFSISFQGLFYAAISGLYTFYFFDNETNYNNDDLSYFYIGDNALNPTLDNINTITKYDSEPYSSLTIYLSENTYYPILLYYGQSLGGQSLVLGFSLPDSLEIIYDGTNYFYSLQ
jgi:hypothetical protein